MPAPKGNKNAKGNKGGGRPSQYKREFCKIAFRLALLGHTDVEMASSFGVTEKTFREWRAKNVEFFNVLKEGKENADGKVAETLYRRALGFTRVTYKLDENGKRIKHEEHLPPDTTAAIFWLKNRRRADWKDKHDVDFGVNSDIEITVTGKKARDTKGE